MTSVERGGSALAAHRRDELDVALLSMLRSVVARAPLFADLRARGMADDLVQDAMLAVARQLDREGPVVEDPFGYARRVVENLARRTYQREQREAVGEVVGHDPASWADPAQIAEQRFELREVLEMVRAITDVVGDLDPTELEMVRAELRREDQKRVATRLGLSRPTFYRRKQVALNGFVTAVARRASAHPCPDRVDSLLAAAGGSGFDAARRARDHAAGCPECARTLRHLTAARHGFAVLAPLPPLTARTSPGVGDRVHLFIDWMRGLTIRTPDPVAVLPVSKSAAAALAAACVGVGGTATCAIVGVPEQVRDVVGAGRVHTHAAPRASTAAAGPSAPAAAPVGVATPVVTRAKRESVTAAPAPRRSVAGSGPEFVRRKPKRTVAEKEFGSGGPRAVSASAASAPEAATPATPPAPAPAPAGGEFGGGAGGGTGSEFGG